MSRALDTGYGLSRLAFGAALMAAPTPVGALFLGKGSRRPATRATLRGFGTRDVVLGFGALRAAASAGDVRPWIAGGVLADLLDAGWQAVEWDDLPKDKRASGVAGALGAAAFGVAVLAMRGRSAAPAE
jgi:hypothetical protein